MSKKLYIILMIFIIIVGYSTSNGQIKTNETVSKRKVSMSYYKDQLTEKELKAYDKIVKTIENIDTEHIALEEPISAYELLRINEAIAVERPELFYVYSIGEFELGGVINPYDEELVKRFKDSRKFSEISIEYLWDSKEEIEQAINRLDEKVKVIIQGVVMGDNVIKVEEYLKDQILATTMVDTEFINKYGSKIRNNTNKADFLSMKAYGALVDDKAACSGFVSAYNILLNEVGIESTGVGVLLNGVAHICNIVKINDRYVVVDMSNSLSSVFNKEFSQLNSNTSKYKLYSLFKHELE